MYLILQYHEGILRNPKKVLVIFMKVSVVKSLVFSMKVSVVKSLALFMKVSVVKSLVQTERNRMAREARVHRRSQGMETSTTQRRRQRSNG